MKNFQQITKQQFRNKMYNPPTRYLIAGLLMIVLCALLVTGCAQTAAGDSSLTSPTVVLRMPTVQIQETATEQPSEPPLNPSPEPPNTATPLPEATQTVAPTSTATAVANPNSSQGKIVFTCQVFRDEKRDQICSMAPDGSVYRRLTTNDGGDYNYPEISPDGQSILYAGNEGSGFQIYQMDLAGTIQQLTFGAGGSYAPDVSPDGSRIVYTHEVGNFQAIWVMKRDGSQPRQVYGPSQGNGWDPVWSPDGETILFASLQGSQIQLYTIQADGSNLRQITHLEGLRGRSDWSPDGGTIATYIGNPWEREIALMDSDGANLRQITNGGNNLAPSFSPDGNWIVFTSYKDLYRDDNGCEIYTMRIDGSEQTRLTFNDYCDWQPRWGP